MGEPRRLNRNISQQFVPLPFWGFLSGPVLVITNRVKLLIEIGIMASIPYISGLPEHRLVQCSVLLWALCVRVPAMFGALFCCACVLVSDTIQTIDVGVRSVLRHSGIAGVLLLSFFASLFFASLPAGSAAQKKMGQLPKQLTHLNTGCGDRI